MLKYKVFNISNVTYSGEETVLSPYFFDRIKSYSNDWQKKQSYYSYVLLKSILYELNIDFDSLKIATNKDGKPEIESFNKPLFFNISHSKNLVCAAVSDSPIGVDIQVLTDKNIKIANRYFSTEDLKTLNKSTQKSKTFTRLWTIFESRLKLFGSIKAFKKNEQKIYTSTKKLLDSGCNIYYLAVSHF